ncbi:MAG: ABC transporter ATP-binding protein [Thermoplasmata archaeon]|jgi:ABC-2 type transport system ATP-binding protein|nr:ABC transporter ATP-binding protein [Thermoplasmata archaeon]
MEPPVVQVNDLRKAYPPDIKAVDGVTFSIPRGKVFSILGPNGAGKTTTVEILEGLRSPTSGSVTVLGADILKGYGPLRKRVGVLPQNFEPFDLLSPFEAVGYWADLLQVRMGRKDIDAALEEVGLEERKRVMSKTLSGGEKRKLGIALSMVNDPELLFLDEPTTGLDPRARRDLWRLIEETKGRGTTVVLTTHYLDEAEKLADDVAIMHRGKIIAQGPPEQLVSEHGKKTTIVLVGAGPEGLKELTRRGIAASEKDGDVAVPVEDSSKLRWMFAKLSSIEVSYKEMYTKRDTLEDVFLSLIGSKMEEGVLQG